MNFFLSLKWQIWDLCCLSGLLQSLWRWYDFFLFLEKINHCPLLSNVINIKVIVNEKGWCKVRDGLRVMERKLRVSVIHLNFSVGQGPPHPLTKTAWMFHVWRTLSQLRCGTEPGGTTELLIIGEELCLVWVAEAQVLVARGEDLARKTQKPWS